MLVDRTVAEQWTTFKVEMVQGQVACYPMKGICKGTELTECQRKKEEGERGKMRVCHLSAKKPQ